MTITQIECFVEAARSGSFTKAGNNLFISQQTVSRQIRAIEAELGFSLFERSSVGVTLSEAGKALLESWTQILQLYRDSVAEAKSVLDKKQKKLNIGIQDNFDIYIDKIVETLMQYEKKSAFTDIEYEILPVKQLFSSLESGRLQMVIIYTSELAKINGQIHCRSLMAISGKTGIIYARTHPLGKKAWTGVGDLEGQTIGVLTEDASLDNRERIIDFLKMHQMDDKVQFQEYQSRQNLAAAPLAGKCVTISYTSMFEQWKEKLVFYPVALSGESVHPEMAVAWREDKYTHLITNIVRLFQS